MAKDKTKAPHPILRLIKGIKGHNHFLFLRIISKLIGQVFTVSYGLLIIPLVNGALQKDLTQFTTYALIMAGMGLLDIPLAAFEVYCGGRYGYGVTRILRDRLGHKIARIPIARLDEMHSGDTVSRLNNDLGQFRDYVSDQMHQALGLVVGGIASLVVMLIIEWRITLAIFLVALPFMLLAQKLAAPLSGLTKSRNASLAKVNEVTQDAVGGYTEVKTYNLYERISRRFNHSITDVVDSGVKMAKTNAVVQFVGLFCRLMPVLALMGLGGLFVIKGWYGMTIGSMIALVQLSNHPFQLLQAFGELVIGNLNRAKGAAERLNEFIDEEEERTDGQAFSLDPKGDIVALDHVSFAYEDGGNILDDITLRIKQGEKIALVGESGCGKSTLLKLMAGFYSNYQGDMQFGQQSLKDWDLAAMRSHMALVDQDTYLYPVSLGENIACGVIGDGIDPEQEAVEQAAKRAHVHHFIESLDDGYGSMAGERGVKLSGGQRQRIAMARAVLRDADVLLLDEPTSALDVESERAVQQQLDEIMEGKTAIIVAHRLSTIQNVDCIYVLDQGRIIEQGDHEALVSKQGKYYQLLSRQLKEIMEAAS